MNTIKLIAAMLVAGLMAGCSTIKQAAVERVDLGDGLIFDLVPVGPAFAAADKAAPGSGAVLKMVEGQLAAKREAKLGPFNGLPYTTERQVVLMDGTVIPQEKIAKIVRIRTPIVPQPIVDVVEPADVSIRPVTNSIPEPTANLSAQADQPAPPASDIDAALEGIGK